MSSSSSFIVLTTNWYCHLSTRIKSYAAAAADLQHPLKGVQGGEQKRATLCSGKSWQDRSSDSQIFWGANFLSPILISPHTQESTKILYDDSVPCDQQKPAKKKKKMCLIACIPPSPKSHIYWPSPLSLWSVSRSYLKCCLPGYCPHFAPSET